MGPCSEIFGGVYSSIDVFYKMAECMGLSQVPQKGNQTRSPIKDEDNWGKYESEKDKYGYHHYSPKSPKYRKKDVAK